MASCKQLFQVIKIAVFLNETANKLFVSLIIPFYFANYKKKKTYETNKFPAVFPTISISGNAHWPAVAVP